MVVVVGFGDVDCYYSGHQIFDASQVVNVEEVHGACDAVVIAVVADVVVVVEVAEVGSEAEKSVEVVLADEGKMDEPLVEEVVQAVERIVGDSQLMADKGCTLVELEVGAAAG